MSETTQAVSTAVSAAASKAMYGGAGGTLLGWAASIDWLTLAGVVIALLGFLLNAYFQYKKSKRDELESLLRMQREQDKHEIEMKKLRGECRVKD